MATTSILVRVQAKGGKFIGPDGGYSQVTVRDVATGAILAQGPAIGGSGALSGSFSQAATRSCVVTPMWGTQNVLWLSAPAGQPPTAGFTTTLDLDAPTLVEITAEALTDGTPNGHTASQVMALAPGVDLTAEPGIVLLLPGLAVKVLSVDATGLNLNVSAWVTMMCGCKIDPAYPWQPSDFAVTATVYDASGAEVASGPLAFDTTSTFATSMPIGLPGAGTYTVSVTASQLSLANVGSASAPVTVSG